jgi:two-component system chemotaxis response regulator CheB
MKPGTVYLAHPDRHLSVTAKGTLSSCDGSRVRYARSSANPLPESAAEVIDGRVIAVILTGSGRDATDGLQVQRAKGGVVIAQDSCTTAFRGMHASAVACGAVTHVLALSGIGPLLRALVL